MFYAVDNGFHYTSWASYDKYPSSDIYNSGETKIFQNIFDGALYRFNNGKLVSIFTDVITSLVRERGAWKAGETYGHYDHVSYNNATWLCNVDKGQTTTEEPTDGSTVWIKETYGVKGENARYINVTSERGNIMLNAQGSVTLTATVIDGGEDVTSTITPNLFSWTRNSGSPESDATWNLTHVGVGNVIIVTAD